MPRYIFGGTCVSGTFSSSIKQYITTRSIAGNDTHSTACSTWTVPTGVTCVTFELWGGGGAGTPTCCCMCFNGPPGDGGAYSMKTLAVTPGTVYTVCVGCGGCGSCCWWQANACGCQGRKTFILGTGLSNFCAEGGQGGLWCNASPCNMYALANNSRALAYGGDINLPGTPAQTFGCGWYPGQSNCSIALTGSSPFGGGHQPTLMAVRQCQEPGACGVTGIFPGGGGGPRPMMSTSMCDCCAMCAGAGSDGLIIITT